MKLQTVCLVLLLAVFLVGCDASVQQDIHNEDSIADQNAEYDDADIDQTETETTIAVDTDADLEADVEATIDADGVTEIELDVDEVDTSADEFCVVGSSYTFESDDGNVDAEILGLTEYKGKEFCEGFSTTTINSPIGDIVTETTYYFDSEYNEFWVLTTTSGSGMPSQTNEVHIIDGETQ